MECEIDIFFLLEATRNLHSNEFNKYFLFDNFQEDQEITMADGEAKANNPSNTFTQYVAALAGM